MKRHVFFSFFLLAIFFLASSAYAQAPATGFPPYGSFENGRFDAVNRQNLNANFALPIVSSPGRGMDFRFPIVYDSLVWQKVTSGTTTSWASVTDANGSPTWGWKKDIPGGTILYAKTTSQFKCFPPAPDPWFWATKTTYSNYVYVDVLGTTHSFNVSETDDSCAGTTTGTSTGSATDGSGYFINIASVTAPIVTSPGGIQSPSGTATDPNGNLITKTVVSSTETDWKDTAGRVALKMITGPTSVQYQYLDPAGVYQTITMNLQSLNIKSNFGCAGVVEYTGTASLPASLSLPNGQSYSFTYEPTPGVAGYYTGRMQQVTLPTGGTYTYEYLGANDSINCADGTVTSLKRTISDGTTSAVWQYTRTQNGTTGWTTAVTDPNANAGQFDFDTNGHETSRRFYQGAATGTLLRTVNTVWASNGTPATQTVILENNQQSKAVTSFDSNGNLLFVSEYDWGAGTPGPLVRTTTLTYLATTAYTARNILNRVTQKLVKDANNAIVSRTDLAYDEAAYLNKNCPPGVPQHNDTNYGCTFTTRGLPTTVTTYTDAATPGGAIMRHFSYDWFGNTIQADVNCCQQKQFTFSALTQYAFPDSVVSGTATGPQLATSATYNASTGQTASSTDENGQVTNYEYADPGHLNRLTKLTRPDTAATSYAYNDAGHTVTVTTPVAGALPAGTDRIVQTTSYDPLGRPVKQTACDAGGVICSTVETQYDALGRASKVSNPYTGATASNWTTTTFDALGRPAMVIPPDGAATANNTSYAYAGNAVTVTDPAGKKRQSQTDALGRLIKVTEPDATGALNTDTIYAYNPLDALTGVTQGAQTRGFVYDGLGRALSATTPEAGTVSFQYNQFNLVTQRTDARGVIASYAYDTLNRLSTVSYNVTGAPGVPATSAVSFTYGTSSTANNNGRLLTVTDGVGSETYSYDVLGRATQVQKVMGTTTYTTTYAYNLAGELTAITYPSGRVVQQSYDAAGRLSQIASGTTSYASGYAYNAAGQVTGVNYGNGVAASFSYDAQRLQLTSLSYTKGTQPLFSLNYWYKQEATNCPGAPAGNNGQIQCITDTVDAGRSVNYSYDPLGRLATAVTTGSTAYPKWGLSWTYDRYGNRTAQTVTAGTGPSNAVTIDATKNRLTGAPYLYDANGNMTNDGANTLTYDAENRAVTAAGATYTYDGNGLRVKKLSGATTTVYVFSGSKVIAEYENGATVTAPTREYIYSGSALLAKIEAGATTYSHPDHLSTRLTTDSAGTVTAQSAHYPFGENWYETGAANKLKFTSYERDAESGNDYAMARYHVNRLGRFSSPDPIAGSLSDPQSLNRYAYVRNDPVNLTDPSGLRMCTEACEWVWYALGSGAQDFGGGGGGYFDDGFCGAQNGGICGSPLSIPPSEGPGNPRCGVDPFCSAHPPGLLDSPVAQVHCDDQGCLIGSYAFSQYVPGLGYVVDWDAQRQAQSTIEIRFLNAPNTPEEKQREAVTRALAALKCSGNMTVECVQNIYDRLTLATSIGNGGLKGGNYNFLLNGLSVDLSVCSGSRCGQFNSLHFNSSVAPTSVHLDTANPWSVPIGSVVHFVADVIFGHTIWSKPPGIPRN